MVLIHRPLFPPFPTPTPGRCDITICTPPFASLKSEKLKILKPIRFQGSLCEQWGATEGLRGAGAGSVVGGGVLREAEGRDPGGGWGLGDRNGMSWGYI